MDPIGGYFSLELPVHEEYHKKAIRLNTGRNCLEYILISREYKKVFLPYYTCEAVLEPFDKLKVDYGYYHIDSNLEPIELPDLKDGEAFLYTDYFGLKHEFVKQLAGYYGSRLIVDNTQAFYAPPIIGIDTFFSCRKFFGVPDGAYLYTDKPLDLDLGQDQSFNRLSSLTKRLDLGAEAGYADFRDVSMSLVGQPIKRMSNFTHRMMRSIDYTSAVIRRRDNYKYLQDALGHVNNLDLPLMEDAVPMVYPFYMTQDGVRERLIENKIFVARYWPNVLQWAGKTDFDYLLAYYLLPLPIDHRYDLRDMESIIHCIDTINA